MNGWSDREFLSYVEIHSETELALFHRNHVNRLLRLAGKPEQPGLPALVSIYRYTAQPLVKQARDRIAAAEAAS
jgi:hypothetical protein